MTTLGYYACLTSFVPRSFLVQGKSLKMMLMPHYFFHFLCPFPKGCCLCVGKTISFEHDCSIFSLVYQREQLLTNQRLCGRHQAYYNTYYTKTSYTKISIPMFQIVKPKHPCNYLLEKADTQFYTPMQSSKQLMVVIQWYPIFSTCRALRVLPNLGKSVVTLWIH